MKSFSNFLIEKELNPRKGEREASERLVKKLNRISKKGNIPDKKLPYADGIETSGGSEGRPSDTRKKMAKNIATQDIEKSSGRESSRIGSEGSGKVKDTVKPEQAKGYKSTEKIKLTNTTRGGEVKVTRPVGTPSGDESRKLGKLNKRTGKLNFDKNAELQAKRSQRINTTTGKATSKGVENFAMNRGGYSRRNIPKSELGKIKTDARRIAGSPSSPAYKEIEASINASDYAGKRAKGDPNAAKLSDVKKAINSKKGKFGVGSANPTRLGKSGGKLPVPTTIGVKQSEVSKKAKAFGQKIEKIKQAKASEIKDPWKTSKVTAGKTLDSVGTKKYDVPDPTKPTKVSGGPKNPNPDYLARMQRGASGMDSNPQGGGAGGTTGKTTFKDFTKKTAGKPLEVRNTQPSSYTTGKGNRINIDPKTGAKTFGGTAKDTSSAIVPYEKGGKLSTPKKVSITTNKSFKELDKGGKISNWKKPSLTKGAKTYQQFLSKTPKSLRPFAKGLRRQGGRALGKLAGPAFAAVDFATNTKDYREKGHSKTGSAVRGGVKAGAYWGGYAAGAAKGAALGSFLGPIGTGAGALIGGALGGGLAGKAADWAVKGYDKVFGGKKLKDYKAKTVAGFEAKKQKKLAADLKANPWKAYGKNQPKVSKTKQKFDQGSFNTIKLKKAKDGSYVMPKGWEKVKGDAGKVSKTTTI